MYNRCCVVSCDSRRKDVVLFRLPKSEKSIRKWLQCLNCEKLRELSREDLAKQFVCHKHFEKRFISSTLTRPRIRVGSYPTLFTASEIQAGVPEVTQPSSTTDSTVTENNDHCYNRKRPHEDHTYFKTEESPEEPWTHIALPSVVSDQPSTTGISSEEMACINEPLYNLSRDFGVEDVVKQDENIQIEEIDHSHTIYMVTEDFGEDVVTSDIDNTAHTQQTEQSRIDVVFASIPRILYKPAESSPHLEIPPTQQTKTKLEFLSHKELQDQYKTLNKQFLRLKKRHEILKKRVKPNNEQAFQLLTANMNPIARNFFRTQLWAKKMNGVRFSAEEKILALSILKHSGACYSLLRKIFILPSKYTLQLLYNSITAKNILNDETEQDDSNQFVTEADEAHDKDGETEQSYVLQDEPHVLQDGLSQSLMPQDNLHQSHMLEDNIEMPNVFQDSVNDSNVLRGNVNGSNVFRDSIKDSNVLQDSVNESNLLQDSVNESNVFQDSVNKSNVVKTNQVNELLVNFNDANFVNEGLNRHYVLQDVVDQSNVLQTVLIQSQGLNEQKRSHVGSDLRVHYFNEDSKKAFVKSIPRKIICKSDQSKVISIDQKNKSVPELEPALATLFHSMTNKYKRRQRRKRM